MNRDEFEASSLQFLQVEFETGTTFITLAQTAGEDRGKAARNRANGRKAYDTMLHFLSRLTLTPAEQTQWNGQLASMKAALVALGEVF